MKKSKLIKTFTAIALGATSIGVIIPIINQITTSTNVNSKSKLNITAKQTDDYKMSSLDMLAAKVYTYARDMQGLSEDEAEAQVTHTCGIYNHMYNQQVQQMTQNRQSPNDDTQYGIIQSLNNQFNIDPLDADGMQSNILPNIKTTLENQGQTPAQAQQVVDNYQSVVNEMQDDLPTNLDVAMQYNTEFQPATANENNLDLVCTWAATQIKKTLSINNDLTGDFTSKLAVYSPDGKTGYGVGSEITKEDLASLFTLNYDLTTNAWLDMPSCDYQNADTQIYDKVTTNFTQTLPLSYLSVPNGATWNIGEILPGYTLHVKITNQDFTTDSNCDNITFNFGVSNTNEDPTSSDVHWLDDSSNLTEKVSVSTAQEKQNVATNYYWKNDTTSIECANEYNSELDEYFICDQTQSTRSTIEEILASAPMDDLGHYTVSQDSPYFIDPTQFNFDGINTPPTDFLTTDNDHTNEKLMLKIVGINDNTEGAQNQSLQCKWCIADTDPQTGQFISVHDLNWAGQGSQYIWVNFNYSKDDFYSIDAATMTCNTITTIDDTYQAIPNQDMKKQYDSAKKIYDIDLGVNITALAAATTLSVFATVCAITGCSKVEVAGAIAAVTVLGISVTGTGIMLGNESDNLNKLKNTNAAIQNTHNDFTKEQINQFRGWAKTLNDHTISIGIKLSTAQQEETFEQNNTSTMKTWTDSMLEDDGLSGDYKNHFSLEFTDTSEKVVYWSAHAFLLMSVVPDLYVAKAYLQSLRATLSSKTQYRDFANQVNTERNYLDTARRETRQLVNDMTQLYNANCGNWDAASSDTMYTLGAYFGRSGEKDGRDRFIPGSPSSDVDGSIPKFMYDNIDRRQYQVLNDINTLNQMRTANDGLDNDSILDGVINKLTSLGKYVPIVVGILTAITALASIATPFVDDFM